MRFSFKVTLLVISILFLFVIDFKTGSVKISNNDLYLFFIGKQSATISTILTEIRLPRIINAILTGISLPLAGLLLQTLFANPLAGPYIFGISAGSGLGVALVLMGGAVAGIILHSFSIVIAAILGALAVLFVISLLAYRLKNKLTVLIAGIFLGSGISAIINLLQFFSDKQELKNFVIWTMGSLDALDKSDIFIYSVLVISIIFLSLSNAKNFDALYIGEDNAKTLGINPHKTHIKIFIFSGILTGVTTAFCGPIAFTGIAVPHITRLIFNEVLHFRLIILTILTGIIIMLLSDIITHCTSVLIPINTITALWGVPVILWITLRQNQTSI